MNGSGIRTQTRTGKNSNLDRWNRNIGGDGKM